MSSREAVGLMKRCLVAALEAACTLTHPIVHRRPWLWLPLPACPLACLSGWLDERWGTEVWQTDTQESHDD